MKTKLSLSILFGLSSTLLASPIGWWRFQEAGATDGATLSSATSTVNTGTLDGNISGSPRYSSNVPGTAIYDPLSNSVYGNAFSVDGTAGGSRINVNNNALLNNPNAFTVEFFIRLVGEPGSYESFIQRLDTTHTTGSSDPTLRDYRRWQIDYDHGANGNQYGDIRSRWDLHDPALEVNNVGEGQTDYNSVIRGEQFFVDTATGSNNPGDYGAGDAALEGDGINDDPNSWHHVAITFDGINRVEMFMDYQLGTGRNLNGTYVHPDGQLRFGKLSNSGYGLFIDEVRYSDRVLAPTEFLIAIPEPSAGGLLFFGAILTGVFSRIYRRKGQ